MEICEIESIIKILSQSDVTEFELDRNGVKLKLSRNQLRQNHQTVSSVNHTSMEEIPDISTKKEIATASIPDTYVKVESPIVGTFYRRPNPESEPFVTEGQVVQKGDTLCIVEAMKIMNEIEAPIKGRIVKILLEDLEVVEYGEILFVMDSNV